MFHYDGINVQVCTLGGISHTHHIQAKAVVDSVNRGETDALLTPLTLIEIYYVAERVYREVYNPTQSEASAKKFYDFIYHHPHVEIKPLDYELCLKAAMIKSGYNIAFSDCFLLALSEDDNAQVLFKNVGSEMKQNLKELNKRFKLKFLEEYR